MTSFRDVLQTIFKREPEGRDAEDGPVYKCTHCGCTTATEEEICSECRIGYLVSSDTAFASKPGLECRVCRAVVDRRHEICPECGSARFRGVSSPFTRHTARSVN